MMVATMMMAMPFVVLSMIVMVVWIVEVEAAGTCWVVPVSVVDVKNGVTFGQNVEIVGSWSTP